MEQPFNVKNPATGEVLYELKRNTPFELLAKIDASRHAKSLWQEENRLPIMKRWGILIKEHREHLAYLITNECGKPLQESYEEIDYLVQFINYYLEEMKRFRVNDHSLVIGVIPLWSFPAVSMASKVVANLLEGSVIIIRAAPEAPLTTMCLIELAHEAGVHPHALQYVLTSEQVAIEIFTSAQVQKVFYTGCNPVYLADNLAAEIGGQAPVIIVEDAQIEHVITEIISSKFKQSGQSLIAPTRVYVHESITKSFTNRLIQRVEQITVGVGLSSLTHMGPLKNREVYFQLLNQLHDAKENGAEILTGNYYILDDCYYMTPTIVKDVSENMLITSTSIFGPVLCISSYSTLEEAITRANNSPTHLAAYFFTNNYTIGQYLFKSLNFSQIGWNHGRLLGAEIPNKSSISLAVGL